MREIDRRAIEDYGLPGVVLMESAGRGVVDLIRQVADPSGSVAVVLCGAGNNGGDGFVIARHLIALGADVATILVTAEEKVVGDALTHLQVLRRMNADILVEPEEMLVEEELAQADLIVDALLGTGLNTDLRGIYRVAVEAANAAEALRIAVDIPSGLHADTGETLGVALNADYTVTFAYPKLGLVSHPGVESVGALEVVDIGIPHGVEESAAFAAELVDEEMVSQTLLPRPDWGHKGTFGHLAIIGGSKGKSGAPLLAAEAALRGGTGLCTIASEASTVDALESQTLEVMLSAMGNNAGLLDGDAGTLREVASLLEGKSALAIGPGMPNHPQAGDFLAALIGRLSIPAVIDADGLNLLASRLDSLKEKKVDILLTPHPGEMARLTGLTIAEIQRDRVSATANFAREHDVFVALKGARTVIAAPDGSIRINPTGCSAMGTAGTGDLLTGLIGSLLAQGHPSFDALSIAAYVHGRAGEVAATIVGERGLIASDLLTQIGPILAGF
jgi:ADP-dependent NAD(P)H-hydrate dehydratase / NAD(P)H-hydrate epimerase